MSRTAAVLALAAVLGGCQARDQISAVGRLEVAVAPAAGVAPAVPTQARIGEDRVHWRRSRAVGLPFRGRLRNGVLLPAAQRDYFTFDLVRGRLPNRAWRRWGTDRLIQTILWVAAADHRRHPGDARVGIADLSRPHGGPFGRRFGGLGHASHQNGLDVDVLYPRRDGREAPPRSARQIDRRRAQHLVDLFVSAGARKIFVGPATRLKGPRGIVLALSNHDDHFHVRVAPGPSSRSR